MGDIEEEASGDPVYSRFSSLLDVYRISFASNAQPYFEDVPKSVKLRYNRFNELRVVQKRNVYYNVMTRGLIMFATGIVFLVVSWSLLFILLYNSSAYEFGIVFGMSGYFFFSFGLVCISSVPTDEVDMDEIIENKRKPNRKYVMSIIFSVINFASGIITGLFPPYLGFIFVLNALWIIKPVLNHKEKFNFMIKLAFGWQVALLVMSSFFLLCTVSPETIVYDNFANANGPAWQQWIDNIHQHRIIKLFYGMLSFLFFIGWIVSGLLCLRFFYKCNCKELVYIHESERKKGYTTTLFHIVLYAHMICNGIFLILYGILSIFVQIASDYTTSNSSYYYLPFIFYGTVALIPVLVMFKLGKTKMFSLMAIKFEYDSNRLMEDGAFMAELINSTTVVYQDEIRWFQRLKEENLLETGNTDGTYVNRMYYAKGIVKEVTSTDVLLEIRYDDDISLDWQVQFKFDENSMTLEQVVTNVNLYEHTGKLHLTFNEWFSKNFSDGCKYEIVSVDKAIGIVTIREKISEEKAPTRKYLLDWALENFRCFNFSEFKDDLFHLSPRKLADDDARKKTFALSHVHKSSPRFAHSSALSIRFISRYCACSEDVRQIDYFISHSWNDEAENKCAILRSFSKQFKLIKGRLPTYWFDKVCIDQSRVNDSDYYALHVLPINISSCKKVLVLLGKTYMKRLWCLWELYCLFVFCNKELALDRVEVKLLHEEDAGTVFDELANFRLSEGNSFVHFIIIPT
jgi:hypothetical protein